MIILDETSKRNNVGREVDKPSQMPEYYNLYVCAGLSNIYYTLFKAEFITSPGGFRPKGITGKLLYLRLCVANCIEKSFSEQNLCTA